MVQSQGQEDPWRRAWVPTPVFLPGKFYGQKSLAGCKVLDPTERLNTHFILKCGSTKNVLHILSNCVLFILSQEFHCTHPYISLFIQFGIYFYVRLGSILTSLLFPWLKYSSQCPPYSGCYQFAPQVLVEEGSLCLHTLSSADCL